MQNESILAPSFFYGTSKEVKRAWMRHVRTALRNGGWEAVFPQFELIPIESRPGGILFSRPKFGELRGNEPLWRFWMTSEIGDLALKIPPPRELEDWPPSVIQNLYLKGMSQLWFIIGMLDQGPEWCPAIVNVRYEDVDEMEWTRIHNAAKRAQVYRPALGWFIYWLPEICDLQERYTEDYELSIGEIWFRYLWLSAINFCLMQLGYKIDLRRADESDFSDGVVAMLQRLHVIEPDNGRFRVIPPPGLDSPE